MGLALIWIMVAERPNWCLLLQRVWGLPITLFLWRKTGEPLKDPRVNERILEIIEEEGTDDWRAFPIKVFFYSLYACENYEKATDILDV
jgi:isoleucyl-tRNA synthetase